jgi:hypothetical protein
MPLLGIDSLEKQAPRVSVDLDKELAKESRKYRPGSVVKLVVVGSVDSVSYRKPDDPDEKGYEGYLTVKVQKMELLESARNEMAELLDDAE